MNQRHASRATRPAEPAPVEPASHAPAQALAPNAEDKGWEIDGVKIFCAIGFGVGLTSFMVGTAIFMIGISMASEGFLTAGCVLYSLAFVSIGGRIVLKKVNPENEIHALLIMLGSALCAWLCFESLQLILRVTGVSP